MQEYSAGYRVRMPKPERSLLFKNSNSGGLVSFTLQVVGYTYPNVSLEVQLVGTMILDPHLCGSRQVTLSSEAM